MTSVRDQNVKGEILIQKGNEMSVQIAPTNSLIRVRGSASLQEAAQMMCDMSMGALGVDDADHDFLGLITERDVMWAVAQGKDPFETQVKQIVNDFPVIVEGPLSIEEAAERMGAAHIRHLIIREPKGLRVLSMRDVLLLYLRSQVAGGSRRVASASELRKMFDI